MNLTAHYIGLVICGVCAVVVFIVYILQQCCNNSNFKREKVPFHLVNSDSSSETGEDDDQMLEYELASTDPMMFAEPLSERDSASIRKVSSYYAKKFGQWTGARRKKDGGDEYEQSLSQDLSSLSNMGEELHEVVHDGHKYTATGTTSNPLAIPPIDE